MRRPHPRFDARRNAWVTNAGPKLAILQPGPKNAETEAAAWNAFYIHMAKLGRPVQTDVPNLSLGRLADEYGEWMKKKVALGEMKPRTLDYYRDYIQRFLDAVGGNRIATAILPFELEKYRTNWHSVQTVQRLYNWGCLMGLLKANPFKGIKRPIPGKRKRILSTTEMIALLRAADRNFRPFLFMLRHSIARPQEVRALQWKHLRVEPVPAFVLTDFKAKELRRDDVDERIIPLDARMLRLLKRIARSQVPTPNGYVLLNRFGQPWSTNAVRLRMQRLRERVGLAPDDRGENVVAYTMRHTGATQATAKGVGDRVLADLMGHSSTTTTRRYQHLQAEHLHAAIQKANARRAQ